MLSQDSPVTVVRRFFEDVWNRRNVEAIYELIGENGVCMTDDGPVRGPDEFRQRMFEPFIAAFPDLRVVVEDVITERDVAVVRWSAVGTHTRDGLGFGPTHDRAEFRGMSWIRTAGPRMLEGWQSSNIPVVIGTLAAKAPPPATPVG